MRDLNRYTHGIREKENAMHKYKTTPKTCRKKNV